MTTPEAPPTEVRRGGHPSAARWLLRVAVGILGLLLVSMLVTFGYPWLVYYGLIG